MEVIILVLVTFVGYLVTYLTHGNTLTQKVFGLSGEGNVPSRENCDEEDYIPQKKHLLFSHQFVAMVGPGVVLGPAIAVIWGWMPAIIWVFVGSIFIGAIQNFGALVVSMKEGGRSFTEIVGIFFGRRAKVFFFSFVSIFLLILIALLFVFISIVFEMFPESVPAMGFQFFVALGLGWLVKKWPQYLCLGLSGAFVVTALTIYFGQDIPIVLPTLGEVPPLITWISILMLSSFLVGGMPVHRFTIPRDALHSIVIFSGIALIFAGVLFCVFTGKFVVYAQPLNLVPQGAPSIIPFLFVTLTCGAVTGFQALLASSTSSKMITKEFDAFSIGYGTMLLEAVLATIVIISVLGGLAMSYQSDSGITLSGVAAWDYHYASWLNADTLGAKIDALILSVSNILSMLGIPRVASMTLIAVMILSFAWSALNAAIRIQSLTMKEMFSKSSLPLLSVLGNKHIATAAVIMIAGILTFAFEVSETGDVTLWPLVGLGNIMLSGLVLLIITHYLKNKAKRPYLTVIIPCVFMLTMAVWCLTVSEVSFIGEENWLLAILNGAMLALGIAITLKGFIRVFDKKPA